MRFEPHPKGMVVVGIVLLVLTVDLASVVGVSRLSTVLAMPTMPATLLRLALTAISICAISALFLIWRGLGRLSIDEQLPQFIEVAAGVPKELAQVSAQLLQLESRVEHAPIALFGIDATRLDGAVEPLNVSARRLLAPGRIVDRSDFSRKLATLTSGQRNIVEFESERGRERSLASVSTFMLEGSLQRLIVVMPVESELEAEAMQAWQQLIRVLTHEIMNSLTPVASLSQTSRDLLQDLSGAASSDVARDLHLALDAIYRRADGLIHFVDGYRSLASVPEARPERVNLAALFARMSTLTSPSWLARGGSASFSVVPETVELMIDPGQLEQALVNLLKNAEEATIDENVPEVSISAKLTHGSRLRIEICDNGSGVADDVIPHIFTPFFTTKRKGNGIGLAMVRQLVRRNGGTVRYVKSVGAGARFVLTF
jgi:signal transduction histidine kinase